MDCSTPGFPVLHQLPELTQTQVCDHKISGFKLDVLNADTEYALFGAATGQFNNLTVNVTINKTDDPVTSGTVDRVVGNNGIISLVLA